MKTPKGNVEAVYRQFGQNIRFRRLDLGISQERVAKLLKISRPSVINIEQGRQRVLLHYATQLARILKCDLENLVPKHKTDREWQNYLDEIDSVE